jgi:polyketide synthase 12
VPGSEQDRLLIDVVSAHVASFLGLPSANAVDAGQSFTDLGFDSLTGVEFRNQLADATSLRLPATVIFDYPNPDALAEYLRAALVPGTAPDTDRDEPDRSPDEPDSEASESGEEPNPLDSMDAADLVRRALGSRPPVPDQVSGTEEF